MQVDIVNTFERKMNSKCLPEHRKVGFLGCRVASKARQVGILELQGRCLSHENAEKANKARGGTPELPLQKYFANRIDTLGQKMRSK